MVILFKLIALMVVSIGLVCVSRASLRSLRFHGFYRFFAWEAIVGLILINLDDWFLDPFRIEQMLSWLLLGVSLFLVIHGVHLLRIVGRPDNQLRDASLIGVEKTSRLVTVGAYRYIRHPLYSSLLFLTVGTFLKRPSWVSGILAVLAIVFLVMTAKVEEVENIQYFGPAYAEYMRKTKRFVPFIF